MSGRFYWSTQESGRFVFYGETMDTGPVATPPPQIFRSGVYRVIDGHVQWRFPLPADGPGGSGGGDALNSTRGPDPKP